MGVEEGLDHRDVEELAFTGDRASVERGRDRTEGHDPRADVTDRQRRSQRCTVGLTRDRRHAGVALGDQVETGKLCLGAGAAERGDRRIHQRRVGGTELVGSQAPTVEYAVPEVLDEDVARPGQLGHQLASGLGRKIDGDAALATILLHEVRAVAVDDHRQPSGRVTARRRLDLDHIGAEPGEQQGAGRAGEILGEVEHADAVEHLATLPATVSRSLITRSRSPRRTGRSRSAGRWHPTGTRTR